jgi:hypothetical protein
MPTGNPIAIPFPLSSFPGRNSQESAGRLVNCYAEPLGEGSRATGPSLQVWRRSSGLSQLGISGQNGYRGGLIVVNKSYEVFNNNVSTIDSSGNVTSLGAFPGTKPVSIARNQSAGPDVIAVDVDNGAYQLSTGGAPVIYTGGGNLPQPNSVCFQDGYLFFTIGDGRVFATVLNSLTMNSLTFITVGSKSDVLLLRGIAFSGLLLLFTTGSCEVWQDAATPAPSFPYNRLTVLEFGLAQPSAIAGFETGFSELLWVAQDSGVYWLTAGSLAPLKVSPPDLDELIEVEISKGNILVAGCYISGGKKFWHLSSPDWSWEFNLGTQKWNERSSLVGGIFVRWRAVCGHPAFGMWIVGDTQSGNLLFHDETNFSENGAPQLWRMESGPVASFPQQLRIARADFNFDLGVGRAVNDYTMTVTGAASGTGGVVRLTVNRTSQVRAGDFGTVTGIVGTTEANGTFPLVVVDATHIELTNTIFVNAYVSGGVVTDITSPPEAINPQVAVSISKDGGNSYSNPLLRQLGAQKNIKRARISVKSMGLSGPIGDRWRLDVTDPVYVGFLGGTQSSDPREVGA